MIGVKRTSLKLKEHKKQVIIFTCQTREEQVMKEAGLVYHKIEL